MSDKHAEKAAKAPSTENKEVKKDAKEKSGNVVKAKEVVKRERTSWTLERAMKYARRFPNESVWASASPASYKSAVAHGWKDQCLAAQNAGGKVIPAKFPKKSDGAHTPGKRAA